MEKPVTVKLQLVVSSRAKSLMKMARDINELCEMIPEWNQQDADVLRERISKRLSKWLKAKQVKE